MRRRKTHAEHVAEIAAKNPNVEVLGEIIKTHAKVLCRCKICGYEWEARPADLKRRHGCPECGKIKKVDKLRLTHAEQVAAIAKINPDVEVLGEIINSNTKVLCRCKVCCHKWNILPSALKRGCGCPECGRIKRGNAKRLTHTEHAAAINKVNPYIEILEEIKHIDTKVLCRCLVCSYEWNARPADLKRRHGCPECAKIKVGAARKLTHAKHVEDINKVNPHIEILEEIKNNRTKVLCKCKVCHHEWEATPKNLKQYGCPRCAKYGFKSHEIGKLYIMVDDLNVPTMMKIGVSIKEEVRSREVLRSAHKAGVTIPALHVAKTWEGPTELMMRIEQMMHENYEEWNIKFPTKFDGCTEFFYYNPETAEAFDIIEETYHEIVNANKAA